MVTPTTRQPKASQQTYLRLAAATGLAAASGAGVNVLLRQIAVATFDIPQPQFEPLNVGAVLISSVIAAAAGGAFFAVLVRLVRRPIRVFRLVVWLALALSMVPVIAVNLGDPPPYEGAGLAAGITLAIMHVVVATVLLAALSWAQRSSDEATAR